MEQSMLEEEEGFVPKEPDTPPELGINDIKDLMRNGWTLEKLDFDAETIKQLLKDKEIQELHKSKRRGGYKQGRKRKNKTQRRKTKRQTTKRQMKKRLKTKRRNTTKRQTKRRTSRK